MTIPVAFRPSELGLHPPLSVSSSNPAVSSREHYLSTVTWATDEKIAVQWQNRTQSYVTLQMYELNPDVWRATAVCVLHPHLLISL